MIFRWCFRAKPKGSSNSDNSSIEKSRIKLVTACVIPATRIIIIIIMSCHRHGITDPVTLRPHPHHIRSVFQPFHFSPGRWSTSGSSGVTHISCHHKNTMGGGEQEKIKQTNKHEQCLGLTQSRRRVCNTTCMCGLTLAWVTSENSTKQLEWRHLLTQSSSLDPILSPTVSGVDRICP